MGTAVKMTVRPFVAMLALTCGVVGWERMDLKLETNITAEGLRALVDLASRRGVYRKAEVSALNRAARAASTAASKGARKRYTVKAAAVKESLKVERASYKRPDALILSQGAPIPLSRFDVRSYKRGPMKARVRKGGPKRPIPGAFRGSGSLPSSRVFRRVPGAAKRVPSKGRFSGTGVKRQPIEQMFGPSVPQMIGNTEVEREVIDRAEEVFGQRLFHELQRRLEKLAAKIPRS